MYLQKIFFGAPGTGKSFYVKNLLKNIHSNKIFRVTIHPEYTYSDFIGQLLPEYDNKIGSLIFKFNPGPFTKALIEAYADSSENVYLILEEMSRGNTAAIFGDIFQLLDRNSHFISEYPIRNKNIADLIIHLRTDEILLPSNFNIIGTVNINDQNVYPMDTAFKRRFEWEYISTLPINDANNQILSKLNNPKIRVSIDSSKINDLITNWHSLYTSLNKFITDKEHGLGRKEDKQIGQFFIYFNSVLISNSHSNNLSEALLHAEQINNQIRNKLLLYLWEDVQGNSSYGQKKSLFNKNITSFDQLYKMYGNDKIFSDDFINLFLKPNLTTYGY